MGRKRAAKLASLQVSKETLKSAKAEVEVLNQLVENLKTLLNRSTDKTVALEEELSVLRAQVSKTRATTSSTTKKRTNKKATTTVAETTEG